MMTARGWWCLFSVGLLLLAGLLRGSSTLIIPGLTLVFWFAWGWLSFAVRCHTVLRRLRVERAVRDDRGPVSSLWSGRTFTVTVRLETGGSRDRLPHVVVSDPVPFALELVAGEVTGQGGLGPPARGDLSRSRSEGVTLTYTVRCPHAGLARFEGVRVETADLCGFFYHATFVHAPLELPILPAVFPLDGLSPVTKGHNELPPPGVHRLRTPGSGSELLDLRDYQPGDPPRTIAWKLSAKRDRLITREYESEVPVRCTLFLDTSPSVRLPSPVPGRRRPSETALHRLIDLTAALARAGAVNRDLTGVILFDAALARGCPPGAGAAHQARLLRLCGEAAALEAAAGHGDTDVLTPLGYALAEDIYPDLLRPAVNSMPLWVSLFQGFPTHRRRWRGWWDLAFRRRGTLFLLGAIAAPLGWLVGLVLLVLAAFGAVTPDALAYGLLAALAVPAPLASLATFTALTVLVFSWRARRLARWRKKLAAVLAARYTLGPDGLARLLEDDDAYSVRVQRFLAEHQVPCPVPLYDDNGRYQFTCPEKVPVLAAALLRAVGRGRDNELFVLCADLLELDGHWEPLLQAVRVARARHHEVVIVCPWPPGVPRPSSTRESERHPLRDVPPGGAPLRKWLAGLTTTRYHAAHARLRKAFARLGVPVVCAAGDDAVPLVVEHLNRLRRAWRGHA